MIKFEGVLRGSATSPNSQSSESIPTLRRLEISTLLG